MKVRCSNPSINHYLFKKKMKIGERKEIVGKGMNQLVALNSITRNLMPSHIEMKISNPPLKIGKCKKKALSNLHK